MMRRFQTFDDASEGEHSAARVATLRAELKKRGLAGFVAPRGDRYQNEYVAPSEERLAWLTGFTGSAGLAIVLADKAALFTDGRYQVQAREQVDTALFGIEHVVDNPPPKWLEAALKPGDRLGYDPWLHTADSAERLQRACENAGAELVTVEDNPIDALWQDRPAAPQGKITLHKAEYAGEDSSAKLARIREELKKLRADALVLSDPHAVAWAFNIRGGDVSHTPLPLASAVLRADGKPSLYLDARKLDNATRGVLENIADIRGADDLAEDLATLKDRRVQLDQTTASHALSRLIEQTDSKVTRGASPVALLQAVKNDAEIAGTRAAHARDGAALAHFLAWFAREAPAGQLTEIDAVEKLEDFRRDTGLLKDVSFPTIAGAGPNGAIVHYRVTRKSNRRIGANEMLLIDSGAQYEDGTTDVTRTLIAGTPTAEMRDRFTRVLRGHIAIATAVFPEGTTGAQLDTLARAPLWQAGLDFDHGTGHGVGSYLSVHEGPARISKLGSVPLKRGMILSNEPGYYKTGEYGIRIENLVLVTEAQTPPGAEKKLDTFETLTLAPIERKLIDVAMLTSTETEWLDAYHARVAQVISPLVDDKTRGWLKAATAPLS